MTTFTIGKRFCGPRNSGNGGYACGMIARNIEGPARARLNMPPPLDTPIALEQDGEKFIARIGEQPVGEAAPAKVEIDLPPIPDAAGIAGAHDAYAATAETHYLPYCFVCGPRRDPGDGLRIFSGDVKNSPVNADYWTPTDDLAAEDGLVAKEFLWAALDCPSAFALRDQNSFCLLGSLAVDIHRRPAPGEKLIVMAWAKGVDGRKRYSDCALVDHKGEVIAASNAVWIELNDPAMVERIKAENL